MVKQLLEEFFTAVISAGKKMNDINALDKKCSALQQALIALTEYHKNIIQMLKSLPTQQENTVNKD